MNRLNTALITFNWQLYQEIPHLFEVIIAVTLFAIYVIVYRFLLYRLPILYSWKEQTEVAFSTEPVSASPTRTIPSQAYNMSRNID